ncbi:hypothetical protein [Microvirga flavescens]|uniref:hypothetical protein n=1 Tax=Microvirga flavescens TaxID=2249811 RepID=UPI000DD917F4|nr:hypothetical protein [Microvirga flavescens]
MIRWLLLIPFALLAAIGASGFFLFIACLVDPTMAELTGNTVFVGFWSLMNDIFSADDPEPIIRQAFAIAGRLVFTLLVFPPLLVAIVSEVVKARSVFWHAGATALLTAAVPFILRGSARSATPAELHVSAVLALTGAVAGFVYWLIAGRERRA